MSDTSTPNGKTQQPEQQPTADEGREPRLVPSRPGRMISLSGLIERIVSAFEEEHGTDSLSRKTATSRVERQKLVRDVAQYVFAVESVELGISEQASVLQRVYGELFGYGPLDALLTDERVTTISIEGPNKLTVRYGPGHELTSLDPIFEDAFHLKRIVKRLLTDIGTEADEDVPFVEAGLTYDDRPVSVNIAFPPFTIELTIDIRVHPKVPPSLGDLVEAGYLSEDAATFLQALVKSEHGFVIVGDTESGKTMLMNVLSRLLPDPHKIIAVERAGELNLPDEAESLQVQWKFGDQSEITFTQQVVHALEKLPDCILLDEIRADEAEAIAPLLANKRVPRQIWVFRGGSEAKRIRSAIGMVARRANPDQPEEMVHSMYRRLPFVIILKRRRTKLQFHEIAEWQYADDVEYPEFVTLMGQGWEGMERTGKRPVQELDLPEDFWK